MKDLFNLALPDGEVTDVARVRYRETERFALRVEVLSFFRFFLLPGKAHGDTGLGVRQIYGEGQGVPLLTAIRKWREEGKAPAYLSCAHITEENGESKVKFTRDIYPYLGEKRIEGKAYPPTTCRRYLGEQ
ncbi:MAG: tannase/feruloyl esterase family alpha/beta hydrolase [Clostridia bacterium]|nr:tannase/feruloyl esterase family alpha/beta hydrolase [Clostridia bacterium]